MKEQWQELKETIIEIRDNNKFNEDVSAICKFLINYMGVLEKQMQELCEYAPFTIDELKNEDMQKLLRGFKNQRVLDKIKAEIEEEYGNCDICEWYEDYDYEENDISEYQRVGNVSDILAIIDKYKAESEVQDADSN